VNSDSAELAVLEPKNGSTVWTKANPLLKTLASGCAFGSSLTYRCWGLGTDRRLILEDRYDIQANQPLVHFALPKWEPGTWIEVQLELLDVKRRSLATSVTMLYSGSEN